MSQLGSGPQLAALLEQLLRDSKLLGECASMSYVHANGFDKLVVLSSDRPQYKLRLHLWWPRRDAVVEHVHNHRWSFASVIVNGCLDAELYERAHDGQVMHEYRYYSPEGRASFRMDHVGPACLAKTQHIVMPAGTRYMLKQDVLHRVVPDVHHLTATLFLQGPTVRPFTNVFSDSPIAHPEETSSRPMPPDVFAGRIRSYLANSGLVRA